MVGRSNEHFRLRSSACNLSVGVDGYWSGWGARIVVVVVVVVVVVGGGCGLNSHL